MSKSTWMNSQGISLHLMILVLPVFILLHCTAPDELPTGDPDNGGLLLPDGFEALVVVDSIGRTRHIAVSEAGDIYARLGYATDGKGTIAMRDTDRDGKADSIVHFGDFVDKGRASTGVMIHEGYLYTSSRQRIYRNKLTPGELLPTGPTEVVLTDSSENVMTNWHTTKPVAFDDKGHMYVPFGSPSDACQDMALYGPAGIPGGRGLDPCPERINHAGIWRFPADRLGLTQADGEKYATGIRSVVGMDWNPKDQGLYAVGNGIDNFHTMFPDWFTAWDAAVLPAETLMRVREGDDYGWPYAYYDQFQKKNVLQPGYGGDGEIVGRAEEFDDPLFAFGGHWAPMDVMIYHGNQFPPRYNEGVFVAFHGSTDRPPYPQAGYVVCFVPFENGEPTGEWEVFADGFAQVDTVVNTSDARYRPMGLSTGPDGSLYISESNRGKIWRIMYKGDRDRFSEADLEKMEARKSMSYIRTPDEEKDNLRQGGNLSGRILYNTYCAVCHQRNGKGDNNRFPPLTESDYVSGDQDRLIDIILNGMQGEIIVDGQTYSGLMPAHQHLDDLAIASIATYVRSRFGDVEKAVPTEKVREIRDRKEAD